jgi:hypothetical protein
MSTTTDRHEHHGRQDLQGHPAGDGHAGEVFDREINIRGIVWTVVGLVVVTVVSAALMWLLLDGLRGLGAKSDPPPSPIPEANEPRLPPAPRLQVGPGFSASNPGYSGEKSDKEDMADLRRREDELLGGLDGAIDAIVERGVGMEVVGGTAADAAAAVAGVPGGEGTREP